MLFRSFHECRYDLNGKIIPSFILNKTEFSNAKILLSGKNFGCGSSREHAPWSLLDFGIRVIIAPSFADIFYNNCFKNSILPIKLSDAKITQIIDIITQDPTTQTIIDLEQEIINFTEHNITITFDIDSFRKQCLIEGLDDISLTLKNEDMIAKFEEQQKETLPWLYS